MQASYGDTASLDAALEGAYGAWFITSFWDSGIGTVEAEVQDGRNVAEAAKRNNIQHLIYSTLESPATTFGDSFPTFDAKIGVEQEILYAGVPFTFVQVAWYFTNLANNIQNKHAGYYKWPRDDDGTYVLRFPIGENGLHGIYSGDVGKACASIFADKDKSYIGRKIALSGELMTGESMASTFEKAFPGTKFRYENPSMDDFRQETQAAGFGDALANMYGFYAKRMPRGGDLALSQKLHPEIKTLQKYLEDCSSDFKFE